MAADFSTKNGAIAGIIAECLKQDITLHSQIGYILATVEHETGGTYMPVEEGFYLKNPHAFQKRLRYYPYYGRGYVQLTWLANYKKYSKKLGVDLVNNPNLALKPEYAVFILVDGFKHGEFTGKRISDYINNHKTDLINCRRCINRLDKAKHIASLARIHIARIDTASRLA